MKQTTKIISALTAGLGAGASLMYLLDPKGGAKRRAYIRDKSNKLRRKTSEEAAKQSRNLANKTKGLKHNITEALGGTGENGATADEDLRDRVRSEMGHVTSHAGSVNVDIVDGLVELTGTIPESDHKKVVKCVRHVDGVEGVVDRLEITESEKA